MRTALRILLAALTSPIWVTVYLLLLGVVIVTACLFNLVIFIGKGETDAEIWATIPDFATLRVFKNLRGKETQ